MEEWQFADEDLLGMAVVEQSNCPLQSIVPIPRILHNQLDRCLESWIINVESDLLKMLQNVLFKRYRVEKIHLFLTIVVILHMMERNIWRLLYWIYHPEQVSVLQRTTV